MRRRLADLVGGEDEDLVLDRPGPQQHLPVVAAGGRGEGRGHRDQAGAAHGEDPVELGEAQVVADGQADVGQLADRRDDDLRARLLVLGLAVGDAADVDVEHVDLAVDGEVGAVGADQHRGVEGLLPGPLGDAPGEQVDAELARPLAGGAEAGAVERLGAGEQRLAAGEQVPLLRQRDELGAVGGGGADEALGGGEVASLLVGRVELYRGYPQGSLSIWMARRWLTDQSIGPASIGGAPRLPASERPRSRSCERRSGPRRASGSGCFARAWSFASSADQVAGAGPASGERVLDRVGDPLGRDATVADASRLARRMAAIGLP